MDEETADKAREENDIIRIKRKELVDPIAELIANFKMNWISSPVRKMMNAALDKKQLPPVEIKYRAKEKYWVMMPEANTI